MKNIQEKHYDVVVIGGGLAGICASISAARAGVKTAIVHDRPVFGGNSSSEIRVHPSGAASFCPWARETGIIEEIMLEDRFKNPFPVANGRMNSIWDLVLFEFIIKEKNLDYYLNTAVRDVQTKDNKILSVSGFQLVSESDIKFCGKFFIDCTGNGIIGALSGAKFRMGRESRSQHNESLAPQKADKKNMGSSLMFRSTKFNFPVPFSAPQWAAEYPDENSIYKRDHLPDKNGSYSGYWWIEIGAPYNIIKDNEKIRDELLKHLLGIWNHIKNHGKHNAENLALDWIGFLPGIRESRRIIGEHILKQDEIVKNKEFFDRVTHGGWFIDVHTMGGILARNKPPENLCGNYDYSRSLTIRPYSIPFGSLFSRDIKNLFMAGRDISVTHVALGTVRVMLTCAAMGEVVGTASALCLKHKIHPSELRKKYIEALQQALLKNDFTILDLKEDDSGNLAGHAKVTAASEAQLKLSPVKQGEDCSSHYSQIFPLTNSRIKKIHVYLISELKKDAYITLEFLKAADIWNFNEKQRVLKTVKKAVPKNFSGWFPFELNMKITPDSLYRINIYGKKGITWQRSSPLQGVTSAWKKPGWKQWVLKKYVFTLRVTPLSFPFSPVNIISGINRPEKWTNIWVSNPGKKLPQSIFLEFHNARQFKEIHLVFDTDLNKEFDELSPLSAVPECVRDYEIRANGKCICSIKNNYQRSRIHHFAQKISSEKIEIKILSTWGSPSARIYGIKIY